MFDYLNRIFFMMQAEIRVAFFKNRNAVNDFWERHASPVYVWLVLEEDALSISCTRIKFWKSEATGQKFTY